MSLKPFHGRQIYRWLYRERATSFDRMTNLSKSFRDSLKNLYTIKLPDSIDRQTNNDGTIKLLQTLTDKHHIESVLIPEEPRLTACLSSQVGCRIDCQFCATGQIGFMRNLDAGEIVGQLFNLEAIAGRPATNIVFMGMGEPLLNPMAVFKAIKILTAEQGGHRSSKKISLSTAGWVPGIKLMQQKNMKIKLIVSLNGTTEEQRQKLMPGVARYPLVDIMKEARAYAKQSKTDLSIGYLLLQGINDTADDARRLAKLVARDRSKVNLMEYHSVDSTLTKTNPADLEQFQSILTNAGVTFTLRHSRGEEIGAACGQLAAGYEKASTDTINPVSDLEE